MCRKNQVTRVTSPLMLHVMFSTQNNPSTLKRQWRQTVYDVSIYELILTFDL